MFSFTSSLPAGFELKVNIMQVDSNQDADTTPKRCRTSVRVSVGGTRTHVKMNTVRPKALRSDPL